MSLFDRKYFKSIDWLSVILVLSLVAFGMVALASVMSAPLSGAEQSFNDYWSKINVEYIQKHAINFLVAIAALIIVIILDYSIFKTFAPWIYGVTLGLLLLLFVVGTVRGGTQGWFIFDSLERAIQPSELCKIATIIILSKYVSAAMDRDGRLLKLKDVAFGAVLTIVPFLLIVLQPDYGTALVLLVIMIAIFFVARIKWIYMLIGGLLVGGGIPLAYFYVLTEKQQDRINVFLNPELDPIGAGYHVLQSKMAIGSGQLLGKGFFNEVTLAQLRYIPARHTDFIFSGIAEATGFIGGMILIVLFFLLAFRWLYVALKARDNFGMCLVVGVIAMLVAHVFENIGMTIGLMPVTGIPLPFISYGGSNMLTNMIGFGIVLNVYMRRPVKKKKKFDKLDEPRRGEFV